MVLAALKVQGGRREGTREEGKRREKGGWARFFDGIGTTMR
jgi:hypothetical protein